MKRIIVLGGGYAGITAANRLATSPRAADLQIVLVNPRETFIERIRLHQVTAGTYRRANRPLHEVLHPDVRLIIDTGSLVQPEDSTLQLENCDVMSYDYLVYAVGSGAASAPEGTFSVTDWESALTSAQALQTLEPGATVVVVGGGFTAIETASEIADGRPDLTVRLISQSELAPTLPRSSRQRIRRSLERLGIIIEDNHAVPPDVDAPGEFAADMVFWCTGVSVPDLAERSGLDTDVQGRLIVDASLRSPKHLNIIGAGDAAVIDQPDYAYLRQSCAAAMPMGGHAADVVLAKLQQQTPAPHSHGFIVQCLSIGRGGGLIQTVHKDDRPRALAISGRLGAFVKETVCRTTIKWIINERERHRRFSWPKGPKRNVVG